MPRSNNPEAPGENAEQKVKPKKKKTWLFLLIFLVVLAASTAGGYSYFNRSVGEAGQAEKTKKVDMESLDMGDMVVNLAGSGGRHYLRVKVVLEYPKEKKLVEELSKKKYQLADVLIATLRGKTMEEVGSATAFEGLKGSLLKELNSLLEQGEITGIYFTDYLVQ